MFQAAHRSSSRALNCICSLWFIYPHVYINHIAYEQAILANFGLIILICSQFFLQRTHLSQLPIQNFLNLSMSVER
jgi:hypothetical protein